MDSLTTVSHSDDPVTFEAPVFNHPDGLSKVVFQTTMTQAEMLALPLGAVMAVTVVAREFRNREEWRP